MASASKLGTILSNGRRVADRGDADVLRLESGGTAHHFRKEPLGESPGSCSQITQDTVDGCEILHQLIDGENLIVYRVSTILLVLQDFATIHSGTILIQVSSSMQGHLECWHRIYRSENMCW